MISNTLMKVGVITKNKGKIRIVDYVFPKYGIEYEFIDKDYPEIQAATSKEIAELRNNTYFNIKFKSTIK